MEGKTITNEQQILLFEMTRSNFKLSQAHHMAFHNEQANSFTHKFAAMHEALEILGLTNEYYKYLSEKEEK